MELIALFGLVGLVLGALVGWFLSIYVVIGFTVLLVGLVVYEMKPSDTYRGSGAIGIFLLGAPLFICFLLAMWVAWFVAPGSASSWIDMSAVLHFLRQAFLR